MTLIRRAILALALIAGIAPAFAQAPGPVPALPDTERRTSYSITASQCSCAVNMALFGDGTDVANWIEVYLNGVLVPQSGNWTITSPSGSLSSLPRPITNAVLTFTAPQTGTVQIVGARRPRRVSQFPEGAGVPARNLNQAFTDIIATQREFWDKTNDITGRTLQSQPGVTLGQLPLPSICQSGFLGFDATGANPVCRSSSGTGNVTLPVVDGHVPVFDGTHGLLKDGGRSLAGLNVSIMDYAPAYGCIPGDYTTDCTAAFNAAVLAVYNFSQSAGEEKTLSVSGTVHVPASAGCFRIASAITMKQGISLMGEGGLGSCILADDTDALLYSFIAYYGQPQITNMFLYGCKWNGSACLPPTAARTAIKRIHNGPTQIPPVDPDPTTDLMYGLVIQNTMVYNFDTVLDLASTRFVWISNSYWQNVNNCIIDRGFSFEMKIQSLLCGRASGDGLGAAGDGLAFVTYPYTSGALGPEGITTNQTAIGGFNNAYRIDKAVSINIDKGSLQGIVNGIQYTNVSGGVTIRDSYIEIDGAAAHAGIFGAGSGGSDPSSLVNITGNSLIASGTVSANGIQINEPGLFGQHDVNITGNLLTGFTGRDIYVLGPKQVVVDGNTATSTVPTNSIELTSAIVGPNFITNNRVAKAIVANSTDLTNGNTRKCGNAIAGVSETCTWAVTTDKTANRLLLGAGGGTQPTSLGAGTTTTVLHGNAGGAPSFGAVANADLVNAATTVNGQVCTLGSTCTVTAAATGVSVGTTTIGGGTSNGVLYNSASVLGNTAAGTNGQLFLGVTASAPAFVTMSGGASITSAGVVTVNTNANLTGAVTSVANATSLGSFTSANLSAALTNETGSGAAVFGTSPTLVTAEAQGVWTATGATWVLPSLALGGTVSGGGQQINNVIIGATSPLAGTFTTLGATTVNGNTVTAGTGTLTLGSATLNAGAGGTLGSNAFTSTAYAPLASPALTGTPTAPTASPGTNTTQLATTAYADAIAALKANLASPTFTGTPAAPTAAVDTNTTQLATTAMVLAQSASATPGAVTNTAAVGTSTRFARADHVHAFESAAWTSYTPTAVSSTVGGTPATYTLVSAAYKQFGKTVIARASWAVTNQGVGAAGRIKISLPFTAAAAQYVGISYEYALTGKSGACFVVASSTTMDCQDASATTYIATGNSIVAEVTYEVP